MVLVDTNVVAYLLIQGDRSAEALALWQSDADWRSEPFVLIEFSNILATYQRARALTAADAVALLAEAERRLTLLPAASHAQALSQAATLSVSAYDARFLVAAQQISQPLVTEDQRLRRAAPGLTMSLSQALKH